MNKVTEFVKGRKTYLVAGLLVLVAVVNLVSGDTTLTQFIQDPNLLVLLNGLGLAALRNAK